MDAVIVAGGRGTRLQPLTFTTRKELLPLGGEPFLAGVLRRLAAAGVDRVLLVVGDDTAPFARLEPVAGDEGVELVTVPEPRPLDTAGGVRSVARDLDGPTLVLNGDILTDLDYGAVVARHRDAGAGVTITLTRVEDTSSYGVCIRDGSRIVDFVEKPPAGTLPGQDAINAGTYVLEPDLLDEFEPGPLSFEREVFPRLLAAGAHLEGFLWEGVWADLGTPERYRAGHRLVLDGALDWPLPALRERDPGVRVAADASAASTARLVAPVLILPGAEVAADATVGPYAVVGHGAYVGRGATVCDAVLHDEAEVGDGVVATGLIAGAGARLEAGAETASGNVLGAGVQVARGEVLRDGERRPPAEV